LTVILILIPSLLFFSFTYFGDVVLPYVLWGVAASIFAGVDIIFHQSYVDELAFGWSGKLITRPEDEDWVWDEGQDWWDEIEADEELEIVEIVFDY